jgi:hypothetical protein
VGKSLVVIVAVAAAVVAAVVMLRPDNPGLVTVINAPPAADAFSETVIVRASGTAVAGLGPQMQVYVNGAVADPPVVEVGTEGFEDYRFVSDHMTDQPRIDVVFVNDAFAEPEDRDLIVESLTVRATMFAPDDEAVTFDVGAGNAAFDGEEAGAGRSTLAVDGALRFDITVPPVATGVAGQVVVRAKGADAGDIAPQMVVRVNGRTAEPPVVDVTDGSYQDYIVNTDNMTDQPVVEVVFINDGVAGDRDRNLFVDSVLVGDVRVQSDDDRVAVDVGDATFDPEAAGPGQFALYGNGVLRYEMRPVPTPPPPEALPPLDGEEIYYQVFEAGTLDNDNWQVYDGLGNAGFGLRRPSAITVEPSPDAEAGGHLLRLTAAMGQGEDTGSLVSGGMALETMTQTYGRYSIRVRTDPDADRVTTGVVLLWPESGIWPQDGEIDWYEGWRDRFARTPIDLVTHYVIDGEHDADEIILLDANGKPVDGSEWHTYTLDWRPDYLAVSVDGGPPNIVSTDPARIPQWAMNMSIQLDAWEAPYAPGRQPTISTPVSMWVDWVRVERYPSLTQ